MHKQHHSQKTAQKSAPTSSGYGDLSNTPNSTAPTSEWVHEPEAAMLLAIKQNTLRAMRRDGRLEAGAHWIYATGKAGGPVTYNLPAIRQTLAERTVQMVQTEAKRRAALRQEKQQFIETFDEEGLL